MLHGRILLCRFALWACRLGEVVLVQRAQKDGEVPLRVQDTLAMRAEPHLAFPAVELEALCAHDSFFADGRQDGLKGWSGEYFPPRQSGGDVAVQYLALSALVCSCQGFSPICWLILDEVEGLMMNELPHPITLYS